MTLPQDPFMLLSMVNTYLRDHYPSLDELCSAEGIDRKDLEQRLSSSGFEYLADINQFR